MIQIIGNRLSQWDVGRLVDVTGEASHVHFANQGDSKAVVVEVKDGKAEIPDYLLQTGKTLLAYAVLEKALDDRVTLESYTFAVRKRERPEDYVYEKGQRDYIYALIRDAENAVAKVSAAAENAEKAVEDANDAIEKATTAVEMTNGATTNANEAADRADQAASNANQKAGYADQAGRNAYDNAQEAYAAANEANEAAKAANDAADIAKTIAADALTSSTLAQAAKNEANKATTNANNAAAGAMDATAIANEAADNANKAAATAAHTAKSLMVVGKTEGEVIALDDAIDQFLVGCRIFGKTTQNGTPTPSAPVDIVSVGDIGSITVNVAGENDAQSMTIATPNGLPGIPVKSGGNYTDANGQQWICDEIDFARGVYIHRVKVDEIAETVRFSMSAYGDAGYYRLIIYDVDAAIGSDIPSICSHFERKYQWNRDEEYHYAPGDNPPKIYLFSNRWTSENEFREWLASQADNGSPLTLVYILGTPIETPLSEEELASYAALHTYRGNTTVSNDAGAWMGLEYVMDAKKYIDRMIATGGGSIIPATVE